MFLLSGVARYLFVPLAKLCVRHARIVHLVTDARAYAAMYLLKAKQGGAASFTEILSCGSSERSSADSNGFGMLPSPTRSACPSACPFHPHLSFDLCCGISPCAVARSGLLSEHRQRPIHPPSPRKSGTRIEETAKLCDLVEGTIRREIPEREMDNILDNIGLPYSTINFMHSTSGLIGAGDADILGVSKRWSPSHGQTMWSTCGKHCPVIPGHHVLLRTFGHRHSGFELWVAGAHRYPNRGSRYRGNREVAARMRMKSRGFRASPMRAYNKRLITRSSM